MAYVDVDKFAEVICNFPAIDENAANAVISLLRRQPAAKVEAVVHCEYCIFCDKDSDPQSYICGLGDDTYVTPEYFCASGRDNTSNEVR